MRQSRTDNGVVITPKFSIIVPVYNAEKYIDECIRSVLCQSEADFELILVDDGSPDASGLICDRYAATDDRVKVIHQPNGGHLAARMNGAGQANGEYILFLDSDDYWLDGLLSAVSEHLTRSGCDMLIFRLQRGKEICHDFFNGAKDGIPHGEYFSVSLSESGMNSLVIKACKRELFKNIDISPFLSLRNSEDLVLSTMLAKNAKKISYIPDVLYYYRPNDNSITNSFNEKAMEDFTFSRSVLWAELESLGLDNWENRKALYSAFLRRAADYVFQASISTMPSDKKAACFDRIRNSDIFNEAMASVELSQFGKAKQLRLQLLRCGKYKTLVTLDRLRKNI